MARQFFPSAFRPSLSLSPPRGGRPTVVTYARWLSIALPHWPSHWRLCHPCPSLLVVAVFASSSSSSLALSTGAEREFVLFVHPFVSAELASLLRTLFGNISWPAHNSGASRLALSPYLALTCVPTPSPVPSLSAVDSRLSQLSRRPSGRAG